MVLRNTCREGFPVTSFKQTQRGSECLRCALDNHNPKVYSTDNNMDPGPVPDVLTVSCFTFILRLVIQYFITPLPHYNQVIFILLAYFRLLLASKMRGEFSV